MALIPIPAAPGVCFSASDYAVGKDFAYVGEGNTFRQGTGRWANGYNVEFIAGFPQKIAGWVQATPTLTLDIPRAMAQWRDSQGAVHTAIGTETHLYSLTGTALLDITPLRTIATGTLTNALTTTIDSNLIAVADSSQTLANGDWVFLSASAAVGGVTVNGYYPVSGVSGTGYNITVPIAASSSASSGGGTITYGYPRVTLTNPFTTTNGSPTVNVNQTNHGATAGSYVDFSGGSAVGGLTLNGEFVIASVVDANNYTITASSNATSGATGGGSVIVTYDIVVQQATATTGIGWGQGAYGVGNWGYGLTNTPVLTNGWTLGQYGFQMLAAPIGGTIYVYDPVAGGRAYPLLNAPASLLAMFVTPERFVVALGINGNLLQMAWCDQTDYTVWTTTPTNTANSGRTLIGGNYFTGGVPLRNGVSLIFTDRNVFEMTYTGNSEVYNTTNVGDNCGLVDPTAVVAEGGIAYWMSDQDFWSWNGAVTALPSDDIRAYVFQGGINRQFLSKCTAMLNRAKRQVRFFYPNASSTENNVGMIYQYDQQCWIPLAYERTCGIDANLLSTPLSADATGMIYFDETGTDAAGAALPTFLELGLMDLSNGDRNADFMGFIPDFQTLDGSISLYAVTKYYPDQSETVSGPYVLTSTSTRQDLRADGKLFGFRLQQNAVGANFRLGLPRLDAQPSGARR
jgi:hypothetical protein